MSVGTQFPPIVVSSATGGGGDTDAGAVWIRDIKVSAKAKKHIPFWENFSILVRLRGSA